MQKENVKEVDFSNKFETFDNRDNIFFTEHVVVPPEFNIDILLSFREKAGIFKNKYIDLKQMKALASAISYTPIFSSLNNRNISFSTCVYFLHILKECGLVMTTIQNPTRENLILSEVYENNGLTSLYEINNESGKTTDVRISMIIINLYQLFNNELVEECIDKVNSFIDYQNQLSKASKMTISQL